jgi:hypothetical protein
MEETYYGNTDRPIKELLQIMLDNKYQFNYCLCHWSICLCHNNIITANEKDDLTQYIKDNRPSKFSSLKAYLSRNSPYYWEYEDIKPRIKWLNKHIKKLNLEK